MLVGDFFAHAIKLEPSTTGSLEMAGGASSNITFTNTATSTEAGSTSARSQPTSMDVNATALGPSHLVGRLGRENENPVNPLSWLIYDAHDNNVTVDEPASWSLVLETKPAHRDNHPSRHRLLRGASGGLTPSIPLPRCIHRG